MTFSWKNGRFLRLSMTISQWSDVARFLKPLVERSCVVGKIAWQTQVTCLCSKLIQFRILNNKKNFIALETSERFQTKEQCLRVQLIHLWIPNGWKLYQNDRVKCRCCRLILWLYCTIEHHFFHLIQFLWKHNMRTGQQAPTGILSALPPC